MTITTKFDMYLSPASTACFHALAEHVTRSMAGDDLSMANGSFAVGQICGIDFARAPHGRYRYLATMVMDDNTVPVGHYNSRIIAPRNDELASVSDFDPHHHVMAINEPGSFSGAAVFAAHLRRHRISGFDAAVRSGGHLKSVEMVAKGEAQLAAIDRVSFELARREMPDAVDDVIVIDETPFYPGLPFVADGGLSADMAQRLGDAILEFRSHDAWPEMCAILGICDLIRLDPASYIGMDHPE